MVQIYDGAINMSWLPAGSELGDLRIVEVFVDYDGPRVFSCRSLSGQTYIAGWAEQAQNSSLWLYLAVSENRLAMVRSGAVALRQAFEVPESTGVFVVELGHLEESHDSVTFVRPDELLDSWLPDPEFKLDLSTATLQPVETPEAWVDRAAQERRSRLRLEVDLPQYLRSEAPTRKIGELLIATQTLYDNVGAAMIEDNPPQRGRLPDHVIAKTATDLVGLSAASFVIEIASSELDDLFDESTFSAISGQILSLLDTQLPRDELLPLLAALTPRGAKSFRNFVRTLVSTQGDVTIAGANASDGYQFRALSSERLDHLFGLLNVLVPDEIFEIRGRMRLYRGDTERRQFGLIHEPTDGRFEGRIDERALRQADHAELNALYDIVISESIEFDEAIGQRNPKYVLLQMTPAQAETSTPLMRETVEL